MKKIGEDKYKRPKKTIQDKLTKEDIIEKLKNYREVDDINKVPVNTHMRYFIKKNNKKLFRLGGVLIKKDHPDYVVLTNNKITWSVQKNNTIFFKKITFDEIEIEYKNKINKLKKENKRLREIITKLKKSI
jgi:hypothetical protein